MNSFYDDQEFLKLLNPEAFGESMGANSLLGSQSNSSTELNSSSNGLSPNSFNFLQPNGSPSSLSTRNLNDMNLFDPTLNIGLKQDQSLNSLNNNQVGQPFANQLPLDFQLNPDYLELVQAYHNQQALYSNSSDVTNGPTFNPLPQVAPMVPSPLDLLNSQMIPETYKADKRSKKGKSNGTIVPTKPTSSQPGMPMLAPKPINNSELYLPFITNATVNMDTNPALNASMPVTYEGIAQPVRIRIPVEPRKISESAEAYRTKTLTKKSERLIRNRQSAQISRQKKKEHVHALEAENKTLHQHRQGLLDRMIQLEAMVMEMAPQVTEPGRFLAPLEEIRNYVQEVVAQGNIDSMEGIEEESQPRKTVSFNSVFPLVVVAILFLISTFGLSTFGSYPSGYSYNGGLPASGSSHIAVIKTDIAPAVPKGIQAAYRLNFVQKHNYKVVEDIFESKRPHLQKATVPQVYRFAHASVQASDALAQLSHPRVLQVEGSSNSLKALDSNLKGDSGTSKLKRAYLYTKDLKSWLPSVSRFSGSEKPVHSDTINKLIDQQYVMTLITNWVDESSGTEPTQDKFLLLDLKISHSTVVDATKLERLS